MFQGKELFKLKATHGMPLDVAIDMIVNERGLTIEWPSFIEEARENGWYDFQTAEALRHGLEDSGVSKDYAKGVMDRFMVYVVKNPHPCLLTDKPNM